MLTFPSFFYKLKIVIIIGGNNMVDTTSIDETVADVEAAPVVKEKGYEK